MVVLGAVWTLYVSNLADRSGPLHVPASEQGFLPLIQISLTVLGVLTATSGYAANMIRTIVIKVSHRRPPLPSATTCFRRRDA